MKKSEKLTLRLKNELGINADASSFKRTYAGRWQRMQGAFLWTMKTNQIHEIGSIYSVTELLQAKKLSVSTCGGLEIFPG